VLRIKFSGDRQFSSPKSPPSGNTKPLFATPTIEQPKMKIEEVAFYTGLLLIPFMYLFTREQLLKKRVLLYLFILSIIFSIIAVFHINNETNTKPNFYLFLFCPLYDLTLLIPALYFFKKIKKRNPKDAPMQFFPYDDGMWLDRVFDFIVLILWLLLPIVLLAYFYN